MIRRNFQVHVLFYSESVSQTEYLRYTILTMLRATLRVFRPISRVSIVPIRSITTYPTDSREEITLTDDGGVVVCWHPEKPFPYEFSKPLPKAEEQPATLFKIESKEQLYEVFKNKKPEFVREELMKITFTTKHRWFPRSRDRRAKKTPPNRQYL